VLGILWERKAATVREIHEALPDKDTGYTTTLKILQNMTEKGLVSRDESQRSHIYTAAGRPEHTQRQLVRDLLRKAFGGSSAQLVIQALSEKRATREERTEIRRLLDDLERTDSDS
jgi:BlaI family penicillinase repressor